MAAPISWTPGTMRPFCRKNHVHIIPRFRGGGILGFGGGGGSADFIFMGARIFLIKGLSLYFLYQKGNLIRIKTGLATYLIRIQTRTPLSRYPPPPPYDYSSISSGCQIHSLLGNFIAGSRSRRIWFAWSLRLHQRIWCFSYCVGTGLMVKVEIHEPLLPRNASGEKKLGSDPKRRKSRELLYTPPPLTPCLPHRAFFREGGGCIFWSPPQQEFYTPPLCCTPPTPGRVFAGVGGVYKVWPRRRGLGNTDKDCKCGAEGDRDCELGAVCQNAAYLVAICDLELQFGATTGDGCDSGGPRIDKQIRGIRAQSPTTACCLQLWEYSTKSKWDSIQVPPSLSPETRSPVRLPFVGIIFTRLGPLWNKFRWRSVVFDHGNRVRIISVVLWGRIATKLCWWVKLLRSSSCWSHHVESWSVPSSAWSATSIPLEWIND